MHYICSIELFSIHFDYLIFQFQRHFIVMQSVFWPASGITKKFDIKGCLGGRYQDPKTLQEQFVLKDQNFINTPLNLGQHKQWYVTLQFACTKSGFFTSLF